MANKRIYIPQLFIIPGGLVFCLVALGSMSPTLKELYYYAQIGLTKCLQKILQIIF